VRDAIFNRQFTRQAGVENRLAPKLHWSVRHPPLHARAMVLAVETFFVDGRLYLSAKDGKLLCFDKQ